MVYQLDKEAWHVHRSNHDHHRCLVDGGGAQELIVQGIFNNRLYPLVGGTLGTVAGALLLSAGIALFRQSTRALTIIRAAAFVSVPVFLLIGFIRPLAGWPVRIVGIIFPLFLLWYFRNPVSKATAQ
jgi:hypothetical protein